MIGHVEIGFLPGFSPIYPRKKKRKCRYRAGTIEKSIWRARLRKWRRKRKRIRKRAKKARALSLNTPKSAPTTPNTSKNSKPSKSKKPPLSAAAKAKKDKKKKWKKRKALHKKKRRQGRHRIRRHLPGSKSYKIRVTTRPKMTKQQIKARLKYLKKKRAKILFNFHKYRAFHCSAKRKAIRTLKSCWEKQRHRQKKRERYRRYLKRLADKKKMHIFRLSQLPKKPKRPVQVHFELPRGKPTKRVEYKYRYEDRPIIFVNETRKEDKHLSKTDKVTLNPLVVNLREDVKGDYGKVAAKIMYMNHEKHQYCDFRWQSSVNDDKTGSKEAQIFALLAVAGSRNSLRALFYGHHQHLLYVLTPCTGLTVAECIEKHPNMDLSVCVFIIQQIFYCVSDLHKIGYAHLKISPSSITTLRFNSRVFVFNGFQFAQTRQELCGISRLPDYGMDRNDREQKRAPLPVNPVDPYMSRRQHFRINKGVADDYESWFYVCARILNKGKPLDWEADKDMDHGQMAIEKYKFARTYKHSDPLTDMKMKSIHQYVLTANEENAAKVSYFIERILQDWKERKPVKGSLPWEGESEKNKKKEEETWMSKNKWRKPLEERKCNY